ncbi:MAG: ComEC/Rec2 family competence protein, partial [Clostridia bacterium]|nr:ComEC/Rec2 family competence protein [Clostridia bacterium]
MFTNDENVRKTFVNFRLITFIVLSLILGISVSYFMLMGKTFYAVFFAVLFVTALLLYFAINFSRSVLKIKVIFSSIFIFAFILGAFLFDVRVSNFNKANLGFKTQNVTATVKYAEDIINGQKLDLSDVALTGIGKLDYNVELRVYGDVQYKLGDRINFTARLDDKEIIYDDRFMSNDIVDKIKYSAFAYSEDVVVIENTANLFQKINTGIKNVLKSGMSEDSFSIAYALLTGGSETIGDEVITIFRNTGVAHIFAVSGLHIGFLAVALTMLFSKVKINAYLKTLIISFILFLYSGVCGFSASSLRACIMSTVMLLTNITGYKYDGLTSVSMAGLIILILSPVQLFCVGFQLSFMVVIGILVFTPAINKLLKFLPYKLASSLATVLSAQISGIPILLYAFNKFSAISIIVNLLFIP